MTTTMFVKAATAAAGVALLGACTSAPKPAGVLSDYSRLGEVKGHFSRRAEAAPQTPIPELTPLWIETVSYAPVLERSMRLPTRSREVLLNRLGRQVCVALSESFAVQPNQGADVHRLRVFITHVEPTNRIAAAVSTPLNLMSPVGARLPIGLGGLAVEIELLDAQGRQVAAMVWRRDADATSTNATVSQISDAYVFADDAASDFADLVGQERSLASHAGSLAHGILPVIAEPKGDIACEVFGSGIGGARGAASMIPGLAPEVFDPGAPPKSR